MALLFVGSLKQNKSRVVEKAIKAIEVLLLSAGLISTLLMVKSAFLPYSCEIVFSSLMGFWSSIKCLLSSPFYICIIINFMVVLIAATSTVHNQDDHNNDHDHHQNKVIDFDDDHDLRIPEPEPVISSPPQPPAEIKKTLLLPAAAEPVKENEEEDTMESTWKSITGEGKQKTKKKQLEKCETWDVPPLQNNNSISEEEPKMMMPSLAAPKRKELRKSETFNDSVSRACRGGLRRDPSTSLEEFNKQVEAFIKKFNDDMKLIANRRGTSEWISEGGIQTHSGSFQN